VHVKLKKHRANRTPLQKKKLLLLASAHRKAGQQISGNLGGHLMFVALKVTYQVSPWRPRLTSAQSLGRVGEEHLAMH
jgi:hypothetical protein